MQRQTTEYNAQCDENLGKMSCKLNAVFNLALKRSRIVNKMHNLTTTENWAELAEN